MIIEVFVFWKASQKPILSLRPRVSGPCQVLGTPGPAGSSWVLLAPPWSSWLFLAPPGFSWLLLGQGHHGSRATETSGGSAANLLAPPGGRGTMGQGATEATGGHWLLLAPPASPCPPPAPPCFSRLLLASLAPPSSSCPPPRLLLAPAGWAS